MIEATAAASSAPGRHVERLCEEPSAYGVQDLGHIPGRRGPIPVKGAGNREDGERQAMKTFELLSIIGTIAAVGIALGAVIIGSNANLHTEMRAEMRTLRTEVRADIRSLEARLSAVEQRQARTEGLLEGLGDAIAAHARRDPHEENGAT